MIVGTTSLDGENRKKRKPVQITNAETARIMGFVTEAAPFPLLFFTLHPPNCTRYEGHPLKSIPI
jgi:hypothetical protein